jgi:ABC-type multidrug transport system fused ATPase/permease subunit
LQTVRNATKIVVLEGGEIVEEGTFENLVSQNGRFRLLWDEQTKEECIDMNRSSWVSWQ